jgi:MYXO-CTERM domain-containing protein
MGFVLALEIWVLAQDFGGLSTGQATDPNTAPLIALMAVALFGAHRRRSTSTAPNAAPTARSTSKAVLGPS